jgi:hypothetical protein
MLLLGGMDVGSHSAGTGIWELKEDQWSGIGSWPNMAKTFEVARCARFFVFLDAISL